MAEMKIDWPATLRLREVKLLAARRLAEAVKDDPRWLPALEQTYHDSFLLVVKG
jgi:hypothetical protein